MGSTAVQSKFEQRVGILEERLSQDPGLPVRSPTAAYWQSPPKPFQTTSPPEEADVVIIGSGITGCSIAKHILESGDDSIRVAVLEARDVCSGATGRNGGHIKAVPEHTYADNIATLGLERTQEVMRFTLSNVDALLDLVPTLSKELQSYCEVRQVDSLNLFVDEAMFEEFKSLVEVFERDTPDMKGRGRIVSAEELRAKHGVSNAVAGYISSAGAAWPYRLITGIFSELLDKHGDRFSIHPRKPVQSIDFARSDGYHVSTSESVIHAKTVIHATNGHAGHLLPGLRGPLFPLRGQMTTQTPTASFESKYAGKRSWSIHYDAGFDYITQSGKTGEIFHGGGLAQSIQRGLGELGNTRDDLDSVQAMAHLGGSLNATFGIDKERSISAGVKAAWTGIMGFTSDGLPLVGRLPREATLRDGSGEWIAAGFNGYGMANCWLVGKHIADSVIGKEDVQHVPQAYKVSSERLADMGAATAARKWLEVLGMD